MNTTETTETDFLAEANLLVAVAVVMGGTAIAYGGAYLAAKFTQKMYVGVKTTLAKKA